MSKENAKKPQSAEPGKSTYDRVKDITDQIEAGISAYMTSPAFTTWLKTMARFHNYSLNNTLLIAMQRPDAQLIAGYHAWKNQFGRQVRRGAKAIHILAPTPYKKKMEVDKMDPSTGKILTNPDGSSMKETKEILIPAYKIVNVFDISDTDGKALPTLGINELTGDVSGYDDMLAAIRKVCPVPITFEKIGDGSKGYFHLTENRIAINEGMSQVQTIKTCLHEASHQKMHALTNQSPLAIEAQEEKITRGQKEQEAEAVATAVCSYYGIDTSDYSYKYIASWAAGKDTSELRASMNRIRTAAHELIEGIDQALEELAAEKTAGKTAEKEDILGKTSVLSDLKAKETQTSKTSATIERPSVRTGERRKHHDNLNR